MDESGYLPKSRFDGNLIDRIRIVVFLYLISKLYV